MEFTEKIEITKSLIEKFSEVSGDKNPIHFDDDYCREFTIFRSAIAPGMLITSFFSRIIAEVYPGPGSIYLSQDIRFLNPCYVGEIITVKIRLDFNKGNKYHLITEIFNEDNIKLVEGSAIVLKKI